MPLAIAFRHQNFNRLLKHLIFGVSKQAFGAVVPERNLPGFVRQNDCIRCRLNDGAKTELGRAKFILLPGQFMESLRLLNGIPNRPLQQ
jgi:hypothetical protein